MEEVDKREYILVVGVELVERWWIVWIGLFVKLVNDVKGFMVWCMLNIKIILFCKEEM